MRRLLIAAFAIVLLLGTIHLSRMAWLTLPFTSSHAAVSALTDAMPMTPCPMGFMCPMNFEMPVDMIAAPVSPLLLLALFWIALSGSLFFLLRHFPNAYSPPLLVEANSNPRSLLSIFKRE